MFSFLEWIKSTKDNDNILWLNLQDQENEKYLESHELHDYIMQKHNPYKKNYLLELVRCLLH